MLQQPLEQEPAWRAAPGGTFIRDNGPALPAHPPSAYARGFEDGAYALAAKLNRMLVEGTTADFVELLGRYQAGIERPTHRWSREPKRN
jgi:hypothetical protein